MVGTCDWSLDVQDGLLLSQDGGALVYDPQSHSFLHATFLGEVGLQEVDAGLPFTVEHLLHGETVAQGEGDG